MGLNIQDLITRLTAAAEAKVYQGKEGADGKLNTDAEISVFSDLLKKEVANEQEFNEIMGLALGNGAPAAKSPRKANGNEGGGIVINVNNSVNIVINITVDANIEDIIKQLMEQIAKLEAQSEANIQNIISQFATQLFAKLGGNYEDIMQQILEALNKIEGNQGDISNKMDVMYNGLMDAMKTMFTMLDKLDLNGKAILEAVQNSNLKQEEQIKLLGKIYEAMQKLTDNFNDFTKVENEQFEALFNMLKAGDVAIQDVVALLQAIKEDTSEGNKTTAEILNVVKGFRADFDNFSAEQQKQFNQVMEMLAKISTGGGSVDLSAILALLKDIKANTEVNGKILDAVQENNELSKAILDAIKNFGTEFNVAIAEILAKIGEGNDNSEAIKQLLTQILAQTEKNGTENKANFAAVLAAIKNIPASGPVDLDAIAELLTDIRNLTDKNGQKLDNVIANDNVVITILESILDKLGDDNQKVTDILNKILIAINNHECDCCDVDAEALMNVLLEILEKCGCNCKCGDNDKQHNEGIDDDWNGDYNNLLGSLAKAKSWLDTETTGVAEVQINGANGRDGKFKGPDGKIYIRNNGKVYDLNGRPVR